MLFVSEPFVFGLYSNPVHLVELYFALVLVHISSIAVDIVLVGFHTPYAVDIDVAGSIGGTVVYIVLFVVGTGIVELAVDIDCPGFDTSSFVVEFVVRLCALLDRTL